MAEKSLDTLREDKAGVENKILDIILGFEKDYGIRVSNIDLLRVQPNMSYAERSKLVKVKTVIDLFV